MLTVTDIQQRRARRPVAYAVALGVATLALLAAAPTTSAGRTSRRATVPHDGSEVFGRHSGVRVIRFEYVAHDGSRLPAYVALPSWYGPQNHPSIPLVIAPHGRGVTAETMLNRFADLPGVGSFAMLSPAGQGRRTRRFSWGFAPQIDDLARMPALAEDAFPWLRIDHRRIYAFGTSMGGQEVLLLAARHPRLLAGVAAFDSTVDFGLQYRNFAKLHCNAHCRGRWGGPLVQVLRRLARTEVGGTPTTAASAYATRSPITYARRLALSGVQLQLWWSRTDKVVVEPWRQSGALYRRLTALNPGMHVEAFVGHWVHTKVMKPKAGLPVALARFGLLPAAFEAVPSGIDALPSPVFAG